MILPFILLFTTISFAQATVQSVCQLGDRPALNTVENVQQLDQSLCDLHGVKEDEQLKNLTSDTRDVIQRLTGPNNPLKNKEDYDPINDKALASKLRSLQDLLNQRRGAKEFRTEKNDEVSAAMTTLFSSFGTDEARHKNPKGYFQALRNVMSKTAAGAKILECFDRAAPRVSKSSVEFFPKNQKNENIPATFQTRYDEASDSYAKVITLSARTAPENALTILAHELQHACDSENTIKLQDEYRALEAKRNIILGGNSQEEIDASGDAMEAFQAKIDVNTAVDELRAYKTMATFFSEIAAYHPAYFCHQYGIGSIFGTQVTSVGELMSSLEVRIENGSFVHTLIDSYTRDGAFGPWSFYQDDGVDAQGRPLLTTEAKKAITDASFKAP